MGPPMSTGDLPGALDAAARTCLFAGLLVGAQATVSGDRPMIQPFALIAVGLLVAGLGLLVFSGGV